MVICNNCRREVTYLLYEMQHRAGQCKGRRNYKDLID